MEIVTLTHPQTKHLVVAARFRFSGEQYSAEVQESELQAFPNFRLKLEQCVGLLVKDKSARVGIALRLVFSVSKSKLLRFRSSLHSIAKNRWT